MNSYPSTCTLTPCTSTDFHHKPTYGTPTTPKCIYSKKSEVVKDSKGNDILTIAWVQFPPTVTVNENDQITLDDGTTGPVKVITEVSLPFRTTYCVEVWLGKEGM